MQEITEVLGYGSEITSDNIASFKKEVSPNFNLLESVTKLEKGGTKAS
jgi:hypothetical protein